MLAYFLYLIPELFFMLYGAQACRRFGFHLICQNHMSTVSTVRNLRSYVYTDLGFVGAFFGGDVSGFVRPCSAFAVVRAFDVPHFGGHGCSCQEEKRSR
jgi:hypothetical protein